MTKRERQRIVAEVRAMQNDQRYGHFTHPVTFGMLLAIDAATGLYPYRAAVTGSATPTVVIYEKDDDELSDFHVVATPTEEADDEWADDDPRWEDLAEIEPQGNAGWDHEKDG